MVDSSQEKDIDDDDAFEFYSEQSEFENQIYHELFRQEKNLIENPHVVGYGIGFKMIKGIYDKDISGVFFVNQKIPKDELDKDSILPNAINVKDKKIKTDVVEVGPLVNLQNFGDPLLNRIRYRPVEMGTSIRITIGNTDNTFNSGTAGALVKSRLGDDTHFILSAGHVMENVGDDVVQPATGFNRVPPPATLINDHIGEIAKVAGFMSSIGVDAAIAEVIPSSNNIVSIGTPRAPQRPTCGLTVQKSGATSGVTFSTITHTKITAFNNFRRSVNLFQDLIVGRDLFFIPNFSQITPNPRNQIPAFALKGDSGSLIMAGWPNDPNNFGPEVARIFQKMERHPSLQRLVLLLKTRLYKAALGLLVKVTTPILFTLGSINNPFFWQTWAVGQDIQPSLDALEVDLVI